MNREYERQDEGKIIIVNNLRFEDGRIDHAWNTGRPCLLLFSDDEYEYVVPLKSELKKDTYLKEKFPLTDEDILCFYRYGYFENTLQKKNPKKRQVGVIAKKDMYGYINVETIYKIPVAYRNEICKVTYETYQNILSKIKNLHKIEKEEEIKERALNR